MEMKVLAKLAVAVVHDKSGVFIVLGHNHRAITHHDISRPQNGLVFVANQLGEAIPVLVNHGLLRRIFEIVVGHGTENFYAQGRAGEVLLQITGPGAGTICLLIQKCMAALCCVEAGIFCHTLPLESPPCRIKLLFPPVQVQWGCTTTPKKLLLHGTTSSHKRSTDVTLVSSTGSKNVSISVHFFWLSGRGGGVFFEPGGMLLCWLVSFDLFWCADKKGCMYTVPIFLRMEPQST